MTSVDKTKEDLIYSFLDDHCLVNETRTEVQNNIIQMMKEKWKL